MWWYSRFHYLLNTLNSTLACQERPVFREFKWHDMFCYSRDLLKHESCMRVYTLEISRHCFKSIYSLSVEISKFLKLGICDCGLIPTFLTWCIDFLNCSSAGQPPNSHYGGLAQWIEHLHISLRFLCVVESTWFWWFLTRP